MFILVSPLSKAMDLVADRAPERVISLLDPDATFPEFGSVYVGHHLRLQFHDVHYPTVGEVSATAKHIDDLLSFLAQWRRSAPLLIHCRAGMGRSPAAAFIAACLYNPSVDELEVASTLRRISSTARPNESLIDLADAALGRCGRMTKAIVETGRGLSWPPVDEGHPFQFPATIQPNKALEPTTMAVTSRAPSSTSRASHGRGSS
jgi:predicted protein tyrosine phosphatase